MNCGYGAIGVGMVMVSCGVLGGCAPEPRPTDAPKPVRAEPDRTDIVDANAVDEMADDARAPESSESSTDVPLPEEWRTRGVLRLSSADRDLAVSGAQITMHLLTPYENEWVVARDGAKLRSGDQFKVRVDLRAPHYVYLLYSTGSGPADLLYPWEDEPVRLGTGTHELPPRESKEDALGLDTNPGREALVLVASHEPLAKSDPALAKLVNDIKAGRDRTLLSEGPHSTKKHGHSAPAKDRVNKFLRSRGDWNLRGDRSGVDGKVGDDGVAVLTLEFDHIVR